MTQTLEWARSFFVCVVLFVIYQRIQGDFVEKPEYNHRFLGVIIQGALFTYKDWQSILLQSFETWFWVPVSSDDDEAFKINPAFVNRRGIYKVRLKKVQSYSFVSFDTKKGMENGRKEKKMHVSTRQLNNQCAYVRHRLASNIS